MIFIREANMQVPVLSNDIDVLAHTPEGQYFDRKSARIKPNDLAKIITAMANSAGGKVAIGIENDGTVTGFAQDKAHRPEEFEQCALMHTTNTSNSLWKTAAPPECCAARTPWKATSAKMFWSLLTNTKSQRYNSHIPRRKSPNEILQRS